MRSFTDLFIQRPVLAIVVNLLILVAGLSATQSLSVRQYPLRITIWASPPTPRMPG